MLLIKDFNMLTVELRHGTAMMLDNTEKRLPIIEINFKDNSKSNYWVDILNVRLKDFLEGQKFLVTGCDKDSLIIALF